MERLQSQIIVKVLGAIKLKDLKSAKATFSWGGEP
jgi:hypothetical protein